MTQTAISTAASARGLTKTYGRGDAQVHALRGVDIDLPAGTFTAIMGPSGSGKSTLMHCLAGLDQPTSGSVTVAGHRLEQLSDDQLTVFRRENLGFVFQAFNLLPMLTAGQNILLPLELDGSLESFQAFNLLPMLTAGQNILLPLELAGRRVDDAARERARMLADVLGIAERLGHRPAELSGGQQQRVAIARALVTQPAVVFADEPTGNLDSTTSAEVLDHLRRCVRELGQTVVMVTHEASAAAYADHTVTVTDGRVA